MFFPLAQRRAEQPVQPIAVDRTPDQDSTVPMTASYTTGSTFGADHTPSTRRESERQAEGADATVVGSDQTTHVADSAEKHADDTEGENR